MLSYELKEDGSDMHFTIRSTEEEVIAIKVDSLVTVENFKQLSVSTKEAVTKAYYLWYIASVSEEPVEVIAKLKKKLMNLLNTKKSKKQRHWLHQKKEHRKM